MNIYQIAALTVFLILIAGVVSRNRNMIILSLMVLLPVAVIAVYFSGVH